MTGRIDKIARLAVERSLELHRRRLWQRLPFDAPLLLVVPSEEQPLAGVIMGQGGDEYGLMMFRGPEAFSVMVRGLSGHDERAVTEESDMLSMACERLDGIPADFREVLREAGFAARREQLAPMILVRRPGRQPRPPRRSDLTTLAWVLGGILAADDEGALQPRSLGDRDRRVLQVDVGGELSAPTVSVRRVPRPARVSADPGPSLDLPADLRLLSLLDERWLLDLLPLPGGISGDERSLAASYIATEQGDILAHEVVLGLDLGPVAGMLAHAMRGEGDGGSRGRPRELVCGHAGLHAALVDALTGMGVAATLDPDHPALVHLHARLAEGAEAGIAHLEQTDRPPESLADWKAADLRVSERLVARMEEQEWVTPRAVARYYGSDVLAHRDDDPARGERSEFVGFYDWLAADYRATRRSRTHIEKLLTRRDLSATERTLLEARRDATLSIFRVDALQPGATLEVEDVLSGERYTIHDKALSGCVTEGVYLPLRLLHVASWVFPCVAGPPLGPMQVDSALALLEAHGAELTPEGLRRSAHLLGHLWGWVAARARPQLQNTDGDPLEWHTATFAVADVPALCAALAARGDVDHDAGRGLWVWQRAGGPVKGFGDTTLLARLELLGDRLVVEVNSERRMAGARQWLERLPGVSFESLSRRRWDDEERPLDDRLPGRELDAPLPPELVAHIEEQYSEHCLRWLDEPVPALGGLTPRRACASVEGRRRVARLIRTMPSSRLPQGQLLAPPRARMLAELGLVDDAGSNERSMGGG